MISRFKLIRIVSKVHGFIYYISRGRTGTQLKGKRFLLLTTVGRKSGKERNVPLAAIPYGGKYILVASFGGSPVDPAWLINIRHNPVVRIRLGQAVQKAEACIVETSDTIYDDLWDKAVATYEGFDIYKKTTSRRIPIVVINPL
jgi:deazaflavin-dependent oxidoreductase (nitroreductase family)